MMSPTNCVVAKESLTPHPAIKNKFTIQQLTFPNAPLFQDMSNNNSCKPSSHSDTDFESPVQSKDQYTFSTEVLESTEYTLELVNALFDQNLGTAAPSSLVWPFCEDNVITKQFENKSIKSPQHHTFYSELRSSAQHFIELNSYQFCHFAGSADQIQLIHQLHRSTNSLKKVFQYDPLC